MKRRTANLLLVLVAIIWGGGFIATAAALDCFHPFYILMIRFVGSALLSLVLALRFFRSVTKETWKKGCVAGVFLFLAFTFQTFGLQDTTASKNAFLTATNVVFVPYIAWLLLRRRPAVRQIIASLLCVAGIALLTLKGDAFAFSGGDFFSLLCAIFFACHILSLEYATKGENVLCINALQMIVAAVLSTISALLFGSAPAVIDASAIGSSLYLIAVSTCLAFLLQTTAQKYTSATSASLLLSMEAFFASIFSFLLLQEAITVTMMLGGALILCSIALVEIRRKTETLRPETTETNCRVRYTEKGDAHEDVCCETAVLSFCEGASEGD